MTELGVVGAAGRMGMRIVALAAASDEFSVVEAVDRDDCPHTGRDAGELAGVGSLGVTVSDMITGHPDVVIDFSLPEGTMAFLPACREKGIAMVIGTTGLTESQLAEIADTAGEIPIVRASNFSMGINLLIKLAGEVAVALGDDYDIEITETHHRFKKDAPSGTAVALARSICGATGREYADAATFGRSGAQPREAGEIGMHAVRLGDTIGEHSVYFGNLGETVTLAHAAHTRDTFVRGALRAAKWVTGRKPGLYDMRDVLGI